MKIFYTLVFLSQVLFLNCNSQEEAMKHYITGKKEFSDQKLDLAKEEFFQAVNKDPNLLSAYIMLGKTLYYTGEFNESISILNKGKQKFPGNSAIDYWLAKNFLATDTDYTKAKEHLISILEADDLHFEAYYYLAKIYEKEGNIKEALLFYNKAKIVKRSFDKIHKDLGNLYLKAGLIERANEELAQIGDNFKDKKKLK